MASRRDAFPFAPLDSALEERVIDMCGGAAGLPIYVEGFRRFLATSGYEGLPHEWYRRFVSTIGSDCLDALDVRAPSAPRNLNRAILLYAGVASVAASTRPGSKYKVPESPLPIHTEMLRTVGGTDRTNLAIIALEEADKIPSFDHLMDRLHHYFVVDEGRVGLQAARVGAGLLHYISLGSLNAIEAETRDPLSPDPEALAIARLEYDSDLERIFNTVKWPDQQET